MQKEIATPKNTAARIHVRVCQEFPATPSAVALVSLVRATGRPLGINEVVGSDALFFATATLRQERDVPTRDFALWKSSPLRGGRVILEADPCRYISGTNLRLGKAERAGAAMMANAILLAKLPGGRLGNSCVEEFGEITEEGTPLKRYTKESFFNSVRDVTADGRSWDAKCAAWQRGHWNLIGMKAAAGLPFEIEGQYFLATEEEAGGYKMETQKVVRLLTDKVRSLSVGIHSAEAFMKDWLDLADAVFAAHRKSAPAVGALGELMPSGIAGRAATLMLYLSKSLAYSAEQIEAEEKEKGPEEASLMRAKNRMVVETCANIANAMKWAATSATIPLIRGEGARLGEALPLFTMLRGTESSMVRVHKPAMSHGLYPATLDEFLRHGAADRL